MAIQVTCPSCTKKFNAPDGAAGKKAKCPSCGGAILIPAAGAAPTSSSMPPGPPKPAPPAAKAPLPPAKKDDIFASEFTGGPAFTDEDFEVEPPVNAEREGAAAGPMKNCPMCGEQIQAAAIKCRHCGEIFDPALKKQAAKQKKGRRSSDPDDSELQTIDWVLCIICSGIGCIVGIVYMIQGKPKGGKMVGISILANIVWRILFGAIRAAVEMS